MLQVDPLLRVNGFLPERDLWSLLRGQAAEGPANGSRLRLPERVLAAWMSVRIMRSGSTSTPKAFLAQVEIEALLTLVSESSESGSVAGFTGDGVDHLFHITHAGECHKEGEADGWRFRVDHDLNEFFQLNVVIKEHDAGCIILIMAEVWIIELVDFSREGQQVPNEGFELVLDQDASRWIRDDGKDVCQLVPDLSPPPGWPVPSSRWRLAPG